MKNPLRRARPRLGGRQVVPLVWIVSLGSIVVLGLGVAGTFSGFTATISNNANSAGTGSVIMKETDGTTTCYSNGAAQLTAITTNASNCAINKLGGALNLIPGQTESPTVSVTVSNVGTTAVTSAFTLTPGACTAAANANNGSTYPAGTDTGSSPGLCSYVEVAIWDSTDGKCIVPASAGTNQGNCIPSSSTSLSTLASTPINLLTSTGSISAGGSRVFVFTTKLDANAGNADMDLQVSQNLDWSFTA